jgi:hypothetical protein
MEQSTHPEESKQEDKEVGQLGILLTEKLLITNSGGLFALHLDAKLKLASGDVEIEWGNLYDTLLELATDKCDREEIVFPSTLSDRQVLFTKQCSLHE